MPNRYSPTSSSRNPSRYDSCFFFQAEDGIRDDLVTGVQTCALPIFTVGPRPIHAYDGVTQSTAGGQTCLTPGKPIFVSSDQVTLASYPAQAMGSYVVLKIGRASCRERV